VISVRLAGTALIGSCAAIVLVLPLLSSNQHAFTGRGHIWAASLRAWEESRLVGLGIDWFRTANSVSYFVSLENLDSGDVFLPSHGHNLVVGTLVESGLVGICLLVLILLAATRSIRALDVSSHQIACFGYLIAFLVVSCTEDIWVLLPNMELFPVVGLVFAVVILARHDVQTGPTVRRQLLEQELYNVLPPQKRTPTDERNKPMDDRVVGGPFRVGSDSIRLEGRSGNSGSRHD
jgi:O-antigen ligase